MKLKLATLILATLLVVISRSLFSYIERFNYFKKTEKINHIIDVHLMPDSSIHSVSDLGERFFDDQYVKEAAGLYDRPTYMRTFYILDFMFPFVYGFFFFSVFAFSRHTKYLMILKVMVFVCVVVDLLENNSFAYYLFHQNGKANVLVAISTSIKSTLFLICIIVAFLISIQAFFKHRIQPLS